jgi:hypothetical protein
MFPIRPQAFPASSVQDSLLKALPKRKKMWQKFYYAIIQNIFHERKSFYFTRAELESKAGKSKHLVSK